MSTRSNLFFVRVAVAIGILPVFAHATTTQPSTDPSLNHRGFSHIAAGMYVSKYPAGWTTPAHHSSLLVMSSIPSPPMTTRACLWTCRRSRVFFCRPECPRQR